MRCNLFVEDTGTSYIGLNRQLMITLGRFALVCTSSSQVPGNGHTTEHTCDVKRTYCISTMTAWSACSSLHHSRRIFSQSSPWPGWVSPHSFTCSGFRLGHLGFDLRIHTPHTFTSYTFIFTASRQSNCQAGVRRAASMGGSAHACCLISRGGHLEYIIACLGSGDRRGIVLVARRAWDKLFCWTGWRSQLHVRCIFTGGRYGHIYLNLTR